MVECKPLAILSVTNIWNFCLRQLLLLLIAGTGVVFAGSPNWQPVTSYTNATTAYGIVTIDGQAAAADDRIGAFVATECRGVTDVIMNNGTAYMNMQIAGDVADEDVTFKIYDSSADIVVEVANSYLTNPGNTIGTPPDYLDINGRTEKSSIILFLPAIISGSRTR